MKKLNIDTLSVSEICLGAMNFGSTTAKEDAYRVLDAFLDMGGNFIDTSNNYAHWVPGCTGDESETLLGEWLKERGCRDKVVLATKVGFDRKGVGAGLKKEQITYWIEQSLKKLGTDYIDLYYAHSDDMNTPQEETLAAFDSLIRQGKVRVLGASNFDTWRLAEANMVAKSQGLSPYSVMQQRFSYLFSKSDAAPKYLFNEYTNRERLRFLADKNMPLVTYSCLLKGGYENPARMPEEYIAGERYEVLLHMAKEKGVSPSALVVAWLRNVHRCPGFPTVLPLFSVSSIAHLEENCKGISLSLSDEELAILNRA